VLISDFSGVSFDYAFLFARPVVYARFEFDKRPYDMADIEDEPWMFRAVRELGSPLDEDKFADIEKTLDRAIADAKGGVSGGISGGERIRRLKDEAWMCQGEAGRKAADVLETLLRETADSTTSGADSDAHP
jgi:hypothetical protein